MSPMTDATNLVGSDIATRYHIERQLGQGGMGHVYLALDRELGRRVAIKMIRHDLDDEATRARFYREARAAAILTHPNACHLYEVAEHEGVPFLVMELLDGEPLSARLARGNMTLDETMGVILPLMDAVSAFHQQGLVHRDLKPSNVFLTTRGVKLLDFGLARRSQHHDALTATLLTSPGAVTGTMRYMAPEQITGDPIDARTDIFALGVLLYEMLTGRIPFDAETNLEWLNAVLKDDPPSLGDARLHAIDPIVARALQRKPQDRYETVDQMIGDVQQAIAGEAPTMAKPATTANAATRVVVLPFRVPENDAELAPLHDGLPEALTAALSGSAGLTLVSNRVAQAHAESKDLIAVGKDLEVDRLLTGSIQRSGEDVRVTFQFVDAADGAVLASDTSTHRLSSIIALQDDICANVESALRSNLDP
jgi:eukaryotic-like serine/threonine-protein kinase